MRWKCEAGSGRFGRGMICVASLLIFAGCNKSGPGLAPVGGRVTLDGQPAQETQVMFYPDGEKSPSIGRTDKDGRYTLRYKRGVEGGSIGWNTVRLETITKMTHGQQLVPERFITGSDLRREVKSGKNTFDFELNALDK